MAKVSPRVLWGILLSFPPRYTHSLTSRGAILLSYTFKFDRRLLPAAAQSARPPCCWWAIFLSLRPFCAAEEGQDLTLLTFSESPGTAAHISKGDTAPSLPVGVHLHLHLTEQNFTVWKAQFTHVCGPEPLLRSGQRATSPRLPTRTEPVVLQKMTVPSDRYAMEMESQPSPKTN